MSSEDNGPPHTTSGSSPSTPPHALCAEHPAQPAIGTCARCGNYYCGACAGRRGEAGSYCRNCHPERAYVAWEDRSLTLWQRYYHTVRASLVEMPRFVAELPAEGGLAQPLLFGLLPTAASVLVGTTLVSALVGLAVGMAPQQQGQSLPAGVMAAILFVVYFGMGIGSQLAYLFVWPAVLLGTARMFGNSRLRYEGVFRVLCYACGFNCFYFVPLLGMAVLAFQVTVSAMGIAAQGRTTVPMGFAIYGLPALLLGGCCCAGYVGMVMLAVQAEQP